MQSNRVQCLVNLCEYKFCIDYSIRRWKVRKQKNIVGFSAFLSTNSFFDAMILRTFDLPAKCLANFTNLSRKIVIIINVVSTKSKETFEGMTRKDDERTRKVADENFRGAR